MKPVPDDPPITLNRRRIMDRIQDRPEQPTMNVPAPGAAFNKMIDQAAATIGAVPDDDPASVEAGELVAALLRIARSAAEGIGAEGGSAERDAQLFAGVEKSLEMAERAAAIGRRDRLISVAERVITAATSPTVKVAP